MKGKIVNIFWGIVLIAVSGLLLADTMGYVDYDLWSGQIWVLVLGVASAAFFLSYFLNGVQKWGWLFPAFICAALALTAWMALNDMDGSFLGTPILAAVALPFYFGFAFDRKNWGLLIPAFILTVLAGVTLIADNARGEWIGALIQFSIGLPFLAAYLVDRSRRWALIPAYVMIAIGLVTLLSTVIPGEWIGAFVLYAIGLPFLVVYLTNRTRRWALIPAIILGILGTLPLITVLVDGDWIGMLIMFIFSAPFFVLYFTSKDQWWALIPAGIFATIGVVVLLSMIFSAQVESLEGIFRTITFLGFGCTFGTLWLRRKTLPTGWAVYPMVILFAAALLAFILGTRFQEFWPAILLLVIGVALLLTAFGFKKRPKVEPPASDNP